MIELMVGPCLSWAFDPIEVALHELARCKPSDRNAMWMSSMVVSTIWNGAVF